MQQPLNFFSGSLSTSVSSKKITLSFCLVSLNNREQRDLPLHVESFVNKHTSGQMNRLINTATSVKYKKFNLILLRRQSFLTNALKIDSEKLEKNYRTQISK